MSFFLMGNTEKSIPSWIKEFKLLVLSIVNLTNIIKKKGYVDGLTESTTLSDKTALQIGYALVLDISASTKRKVILTRTILGKKFLILPIG